MQHHTCRSGRHTMACTRCGREIQRGEDYWFWNGAGVCADCLPDAAREEFAPFRHTREKERFDDFI